MTETTLDIAAATALGNELTNKTNEFAEAYRADAGLRARAAADPRAVLAERGLDTLAAPGAEVRIVADTDDTIHFMLPPDPNAEMADNALVSVAGGFTVASAGNGQYGGRNYWGSSSMTQPSCYVAPGATVGGTSSGW